MDYASRVLGVFIATMGATSLGECRICVVERTRSGKVIMRGPDEDGTMKILINHLTASELELLVNTLHHDRTEAAI